MSDTERLFEVEHNAGDSPGIEYMEGVDVPPPKPIQIRCIDYSATRIETTDITDLVTFLKQPRPDWAVVRWIDVDELHPYVINQFRKAYGYHTLAAEDAMHTGQRPRVEQYGDSLYIVVRMFMLRDGALTSEQVSFFLNKGLVVTFQELEGDCWGRIRERLAYAESRMRSHDVDFLTYTLLDAIVDHCFPLLEHYGDRLESLEDRVMAKVNADQLLEIQEVRRDLLTLRRVLWPMREVVALLQKNEQFMSADTRTYLRDVYEHNVQIIDMIETFRETVSALSELYMSMTSNRMNEVMKVLTVISTIFIPITFIAGVYGMNFEYLPELQWKWSYPSFWIVCGVITTSLLGFFWRRGWLSKG